MGEMKTKAGKTTPDLEDYRRNGMYCVTGLAYNSAENEATCVDTSEVVFRDQVLDNPYKCDPTHPEERCYIKFDTSHSEPAWIDLGKNDRISVNCSCGLEDESSGYCKDVIGTDPYIKYARQMYYTLSNSNCHTLDRTDIRA